MPRPAPEVVLEKARRAWRMKDPWNGLIYDCFRYAAPGMNPYVEYGVMNREGTGGTPRHDHLFDGTLGTAAVELTDRMTSEVFTPGQDWGQMSDGPEFAPDEERPTKRRSMVEQIQRKVFGAIHSSDFYLSARMLCFDAIVSGTGVMRVGTSHDPARLIGYEPVSQSEVALEGAPRQQVWGYYRRAEMTAREVAAFWPDADKLKEESQEREPRRYKVNDCTYYDPFTAIWYYDLLVEDEELKRIYTEDLLLSPWCTWRYDLLPGEVQGRSPVMRALPDARTLNHAKRIQLQAASIRSVGAYTYKNDTGFNPRTVRMDPGALIQVGTNDRTNPTLRALELSGDLGLNQLIMEELASSIRKTMMTENLPPMTAAVRSPTELMQRQKENMVRLGGPYLRLTEEVGRPVVRSTAYTLAKNGHLPELRAVMPKDQKSGDTMPLMLDGTDISVKFISPLATAQQLSDAEQISRWAEMSQAAAGMEGFLSGAKTEDIAEVLAEKLSIPPELVRDKQEREQLMQQQMAQQQAGAGALPSPDMAMQGPGMGP